MSRRGRGEGTIGLLADGRWLARTSFDGQRKSYYAATRGAAAKRLSAAIEAHRDGLPAPNDKQTFAQFVDKWVAAVAPTLRPKTAWQYAQLLQDHAVPFIGRIPLTKLKPSDLVRVYDLRRKAGAAPRSVLQLHRAIFRCLRYAERWGDIARNVAALVDAPKVVRSEMRALSGEEARALLKVVEGDRLEAFLVLALSTGMRSGEMLGLTWREINFDHGSISVVASLQPNAEHQLVLMESKTPRSRRVIDIEPRVVASLRRHRAA